MQAISTDLQFPSAEPFQEWCGLRVYSGTNHPAESRSDSNHAGIVAMPRAQGRYKLV